MQKPIFDDPPVEATESFGGVNENLFVNATEPVPTPAEIQAEKAKRAADLAEERARIKKEAESEAVRLATSEGSIQAQQKHDEALKPTHYDRRLPKGNFDPELFTNSLQQLIKTRKEKGQDVEGLFNKEEIDLILKELNRLAKEKEISKDKRKIINAITSIASFVPTDLQEQDIQPDQEQQNLPKKFAQALVGSPWKNFEHSNLNNGPILFSTVIQGDRGWMAKITPEGIIVMAGEINVDGDKSAPTKGYVIEYQPKTEELPESVKITEINEDPDKNRTYKYSKKKLSSENPEKRMDAAVFSIPAP